MFMSALLKLLCNFSSCELFAVWKILTGVPSYRSHCTSMSVIETQGQSAPQGLWRDKAYRYSSPWCQCRYCDIVSAFLCIRLIGFVVCLPLSGSECVWYSGKVQVYHFILRVHHSLTVLLFVVICFVVLSKCNLKMVCFFHQHKCKKARGHTMFNF
jgi:hypothetical protein